jgi:hypothetical protein
MTPGQLNRWTLNQWWKVRMLAGWEHQRSQVSPYLVLALLALRHSLVILLR